MRQVIHIYIHIHIHIHTVFTNRLGSLLATVDHYLTSLQTTNSILSLLAAHESQASIQSVSGIAFRGEKPDICGNKCLCNMKNTIKVWILCQLNCKIWYVDGKCETTLMPCVMQNIQIRRQTEVRLACSPSSQGMDIVEVEQCRYQMTVYDPAMCLRSHPLSPVHSQKQQHEELWAQHPQMYHDACLFYCTGKYSWNGVCNESQCEAFHQWLFLGCCLVWCIIIAASDGRWSSMWLASSSKLLVFQTKNMCHEYQLVLMVSRVSLRMPITSL